MNVLLLSVAVILSQREVAVPAAMVLTTRGSVSLERRQEKPRSVGAMDLLQPGDQLRVARGGEATLVIVSDGHRERLAAETAVTVGVQGCFPAGVVERITPTALSDANLASLRELVQSGRGTVTVLRSPPGPRRPTVTPMYGAVVLTDRPELRWAAVSRAVSYQVELLSREPGKERRTLWRVKVTETRLPFPEQASSLQAGSTYHWRIRARLPDGEDQLTVESQFQVATRREIQQLSQLAEITRCKKGDNLLVAAVIFEAHGILDEALRLYEQLANLAPHEANYQATLAVYHARAGRPREANEARERARKLGFVYPAP